MVELSATPPLPSTDQNNFEFVPPYLDCAHSWTHNAGMQFDIDDYDFPGCDESYDASDDIYAGTAACDDGSDQDYEPCHEDGEDDGTEFTRDPDDDGREPMDGYVD